MTTTLTTGKAFALATTMALILGACGGGDAEEETVELGDPVTDNPCDVPVEDQDAMLEWVEAESYKAWPGEAALHDSAGPHFGNVRTWVSDGLNDSLNAGSEPHPLCSVAVKELYGEDEERDGWSVMVKVAEGSDDSTWYWYEIFDDKLYAAGTNFDKCTGCHSAGADMIRTPAPL